MLVPKALYTKMQYNNSEWRYKKYRAFHTDKSVHILSPFSLVAASRAFGAFD